MSRFRSFGWSVGGVVVVIGAVCALLYIQSGQRDGAASTGDNHEPAKHGSGVVFATPALAKDAGIETQVIEAAHWRPKIHVDGLVVPNPDATFVLRAPFAGVVRADRENFKLRLGASVKSHETLALFEARFTATEGLDFRIKLVEAEARHKSALEVLQIRQARVDRLKKLPAGILSQGDLDAASVLLSEAKMQAAIALTQKQIWAQALETVGKKLIVSLQSPIAGEIASVAAQPGANVSAGDVLARVIDHRRVLIRLDFPLSATNARPNLKASVQGLGSAGTWPARLRGQAPHGQSASQRMSWLYEVIADEEARPHWQVGRFVRAEMDDPGTSSRPAFSLPATALLLHQGRTLVYVETEPGHYQRREVEVLGRVGETLFIASGGWDAAGNRVVIRGAQVLLSEEFRPALDDDED